ncbi:MAG: hypothetical protein WCQ96_00515 [Patescibacteria group bacterium]
MKKMLVLALVLVCGFLSLQNGAASNIRSDEMHSFLFSPTPTAFATDSNTPAQTPASSTDSDTPAAVVPAESEPAPLYPESGDAPATATTECSDISGSGGLIPCGKYFNDPDTSWDECKACDFCAIPLTLQLVLNYLIKIVGVVTVLAIILGQLIAMTAVGETDVMVKIKSVLGSALMGFGYVLAAWVIVNSILAFIGYTDPLDGQWYTMC